MNMGLLLAELGAAGVRVSVDGDKLNIKVKTSPVAPEVIAKLKEHKKALITFLTEANDSGNKLPRLSAEQKSQGVKLSPQQQSLWPIYQSGEGAERYNIPLFIDLHGFVNVGRLADALKQCYRQFDALHCVFVEQNGKVLIKPAIDTNWQLEIESIEAVDVVSEQKRQFVLTEGPLFVARLLRLADDHHVLVLNFPHIVIDGWSIAQLWQTLVDLYGGETLGSEPDYLDYLAELPSDNRQDYWLERLNGYEPLQLHSAGARVSDQHHFLYSKLDEQTSRRLEEQALQNQVSIFCCALQLWAKVVGQYTNRQDVVISTPSANRAQGAHQGILGYLVSMVPVRCRLDTPLTQFQEQLNQDIKAGNVDFNQLLSNLDLQTQGGRHPLQQVVFAWQDGLMEMIDFEGCRVSRRETKLIGAKFPLMLSMYLQDGTYQMKWEFDTSVISRDSVKLLQQQLISTFRGELQTALLPPGKTKNLDAGLAERIQAQVNIQPDAVAVELACGSSMSYVELFEAAQIVAAALQVKGLKPGERVGLSLPHGHELAITIVAIVLAGGVYVPLPEQVSQTRLLSMIEQCNMRLCIGLDEQPVTGIEWLNFKQDLQANITQYQAALTEPQSPVYINFSSGTTGEPKGIECLQQGVIRLVQSPEHFCLNRETRMMCAAPATFDAFTLEFWGPLLNGGRICFAPVGPLDVKGLRQLIAQRGINTAWLTAALFHTLTDIDASAFAGLEQLLVGGDVVSPNHVARVYQANTTIQVINGYGPTENTTFTCCFPIPRTWPQALSLPLGSAITGTDVFILDASERVQPQGCVGEIVTSGLGLAKGYLVAGQNTGRFVKLGNTRAFKTGDLGYFDLSGRLHFLGRGDQQVKINGYRVELAAINRKLSGIPGVLRGETIVVGQSGSGQLVGFVQMDEGEFFGEGQLLTELSECLPAYMVPAVLVEMTDFPLTVNGKVDQKALVQHFEYYNQSLQHQQRALNTTEQKVADAWQAVLAVTVNSPSAGFYRLGGHSLAAVKLAGLLQQQFNVDISSIEILQHPVLERFASLLEKKQAENKQNQRIELLSEQQKQAGVALSAEQQLLWPIYRLAESPERYNIILALDIQGTLVAERLAETLKAFYRRFNALHCVFAEAGDEIVMQPSIDPDWQLQVETVDQVDLSSEQQRLFNLTQGPLFIARLLQLSDKHQVLVLNFPHIVMDGWSLSQLWRGIVEHYHGRDDVLAAGPDFLDYLAHSRTADNQAYWQKRLDAYEPLQLHNVAVGKSGSRHWLDGRIGLQTSQRLEAFAQQQQVSLFSAALYLWAKVVGRYSNRNDVVISAPFANRENGAAQNIPGYTVAMVPVRCQLDRGLTAFAESLHQDMQAADCDFNQVMPVQGLQQVVFAWQDGLLDLTGFEGCKTTLLQSELVGAKFPLMLTMHTSEGGFRLKWEFDPNVIAPSGVEWFQQQLIAMIDCQGRSTVTLPSSESRQVSGCLYSRLQKLADEQPNTVALTVEGETTRYSELMEAAQQMAASLQAKGVKPGDRVGLRLPHGRELAIAIVATVMAGGVYVPVALNEPAARLVAMASQCEMCLCIDLTGESLVSVESIAFQQALSGDVKQYRPVMLSGQSPVYINFSSGTTGEPKGIECLHQGIIRLVENPQHFSLNSQTRMLCAAPATFDAFTLEFWGPLLNGGQVCFAQPEPLHVAQLRNLIQNHGVNSAWLTAALFHTLVDIDAEAFNGLEQLLVGGDVVSPSHVRRVYDANDDIRIINGYGPTENTTFTCCFPIPRSWPCHLALPVGTAVPGSDVFIIDELGHEKDDGCIGEVATAGLGLAQGYLDPMQEKGRFVTLGDVRVYRTGDIGYRDLSGLVHFAGRADRQMKVNGFRIETAAVNRVLNELAGVVHGETIVVGEAGSGQLIGFVQMDGCRMFDEGVLLAELSRSLPTYMVPATLLELNDFPLTGNGKIDSRGLSDAYQSHLVALQQSQRPLTVTENVVAQVWLQILIVPSCTPTCNFYRLGGNSLQLLKVHHALESAFECRLPLSLVVANSVLANLATAIEQSIRTSEQLEVPQAAQTSFDPQCFALSPQQHRLWLLHQQQVDSAYNISFYVELPQALVVDDVEIAICTLVEKQTALRTRFFEHQGEPRQGIIDMAQWQLERRKLSEPQWSELLEVTSAKVFDLTQGVAEFTLVERDNGQWSLLACVHHLCFDGASLSVMLKQLSTILTGSNIEPVTPYGAYGNTLSQESLNYWHTQLAGFEGTTEVPSDLPIGQTQAYCSNLEFPLDGKVTHSLQNLARRHEVSDYNLHFGLFLTALSRVSQNNDLVVAMPVENRGDRAFADTIGFFANTLPLRFVLNESESFADMLQRLQYTTSQSLAYQNVDLATLLAEKADGGLGLTDVSFSLNRVETLNIATSQVELNVLANQAPKSAFHLTVSQSQEMTHWQVAFDGSRYSNALVMSLLQTMSCLAGQVIGSPGRILGDLAVADRPASAKSVMDAHLLPIDRIKAQVEASPETLALMTAEQSLDYRSLWFQACQVALALKAQGVVKGDRVAVMMQRDFRLPVTLLGIWLAEAAYVPLDPGYPVERIKQIVADVSPLCVISDEANVPNDLAISYEQLTAQSCRGELSQPELNAEDLAYIIFTSGSSGRPKGVEVSFRGLAGLFEWAKATYSQEELSLVYSATSVCFDPSVFELFTFWSLGATVFFADNPLAMAQDAQSVDIRLLSSVPSVLSEILKHGELPASLRAINLGGEALPQSLAEKVNRDYPHVRLFNLYGPTENTIISTCQQVDLSREKTVLIGKPVNGTGFMVVDQQNRPLPNGFAGELVLFGDNLAMGYRGQSQLSEKAFVLFAGRRVYKTGDKVRADAGGALQYLGRIDRQVKVSGLRIELAEIEQCFLSAPGCEDAAVVCKDDKLLAFVTTDAKLASIRAHIKRFLPQYMLPHHIEVLDKMPINASGKKDYKALQSLSLSNNNQEQQKLTGIQAKVAQVWCEVLGLDITETAISPDTDFRSLGGYSLLFLQLVKALQSAFGIKLKVADLFAHQSLAALVEFIDNATPLAETATKQVVGAPISPQQSSLWYSHQYHGDQGAYNLFSALTIDGPLDCERLLKAIKAVYHHHDILQSRFEEQGEAVRLIRQKNADWSVALESCSETQLQDILRIERGRSFDLQNGPLLVARLLKIAENHHVLTINMPHIIADWLSIKLMFEQISSHYQGRELPSNPLDFFDYLANPADYEQPQGFWLQYLTGAQWTVDLPYERAPIKRKQRLAEQLSGQLSVEAAQALMQLSQQLNVSTYAVGLAVFSYLIKRFAISEEPMVWTPYANRKDADEAQMLGYFIAMLPLRSPTRNGLDFARHCLSVHEHLQQAFQYADIDIVELMRALGVERNSGNSPLYQVVFSWLAGDKQPMALGQCQSETLSTQSQLAKFDLMLSVKQGEDDQLTYCWEFDRHLFTQIQVESLQDTFEHLLRHFGQTPKQILGETPLLSPQGYEQYYGHLNLSFDSIALPNIVQAFSGQVARAPEQIALQQGERSLSYAALDDLSNQVAAMLSTHCQDCEFVGVSLPRSIEQVASVLAILKLGLAYVPLDLDKGEQVIEHQAAAAKIGVAVGRSDKPVPGCRTLDFDWASHFEPKVFEFKFAASKPAYVNFSSGSEGEPKGIVCLHQGVTRLVKQANYVDLSDRTATLLAASFSFDAYTFELWAALLNGGRCIIATDKLVTPAALRRFISQDGLNTVWLTAALFNRIVDTDVSCLDKLETLLVGGDVVSPKHVAAVYRSNSQINIINGYGPTENTTFTCTYTIARELDEEQAIAIGKPVNHSHVWVMDEHLQPLPLGFAGELVTGGAGLALKYLNGPKLTEQQFVEVECFDQKTRAYKTGDRARLGSNGLFEYLGRSDSQIKINGYRIDLEAIEHTLGGLDGIRSVKVGAHKDQDKQALIAFYTADTAFEPQLLKSYLKTRLPSFMVPQYFDWLERLPLTANGKADVRQLLSNYQNRKPSDVAVTTYGFNTNQQIIADLIVKVSGLVMPDSQTCMFDLGINSMAIINLHHELEQVTGTCFDIDVIFENTSLSELEYSLFTKEMEKT
ncbi:non-ribosomal peptide synthetase [Alteromonas stellipolaris]|uniref:non-ribosomal peptide synthetase n=1 Tax=Alteromonas stellipolaris TaxID=233316 RepID=UPI001D936CA2|nr:non-ribosomal peptide synthetase [Alteromonas stellipolaris]MBZ2163253.1 amino acid adenylation domain-containing protein [Alteromonas stellipolaris]